MSKKKLPKAELVIYRSLLSLTEVQVIPLNRRQRKAILRIYHQVPRMIQIALTQMVLQELPTESLTEAKRSLERILKGEVPGILRLMELNLPMRLIPQV